MPNKQMGIDDLVPGMYVSNVIQQQGPMKIKRIGFIKSPEMIDGLKEMGVQRVEVDAEKSLHVEFEQKDNSTLTEKLLERDKHIEHVDRELSQQFHNSLAMSAVDEMPSHLDLYAKPYLVMTFLVLLGFIYGFVVMQTPALWQHIKSSGKFGDNFTAAEEQTVQGNNTAGEQLADATLAPIEGDAIIEDEADLNKVTVPDKVTTTNTPESKNADSLNNKDSEAVVSDRSSEQDDVIAAINDDSQETAENVFFADQTDDDVPENAENTIVNEVPLQEDINSQTSADVADSIQGIALADGERVLGYQGESIDDEPDNLVTPSVTQESGVDPELLARINNAIESLNDDPVVSNADPVTVRDTFLRVDQLSPLIQDQLPSLSFSAHFYASDPQSRFVRVNGRRLEEGDNITADLSIDEINADTVLLDFRGQRFTMKALTDWQ